MENLIFLLKSTFNEKLDLTLVNFELHFKFFIGEQEAEEEFVSVK